MSLRYPQGGETKPTRGSLDVHSWDKAERTARATKFAGVCVLAAMFSVILPLLHFVLVPAFLIAAPVIFFSTLNREAVVVGGEGQCPKCAATFKIERARYVLPLHDQCGQCQTSITVEEA